VNDKIIAILSVCGEKLKLPIKVEHLWIVIGDHPSEDITKFFITAFHFIRQNLEKGNVLVHCQAGISRSCTIVIAFLMQQMLINYKEAFNMVKAKRPIANPNKGFIKQLKNF
jgi:protein-tyrosine phosphatase